MNDFHGSRFGTCVLDVLSVWFLIRVLKLIANVFLEILFLFNFPVERSMDVQNSFIRVLVSCLFALGLSAADLILVWIVEGPCSETFATTRIWVDRCWDAMDERLLKPLHEFTEATRELKRAEEGSEKENWDTDVVCKSRVCLDEGAGDAEEEVAGWAESGDAREAIGAADARIDSRAPISLSEDVFVILSVSDVLVDYVGRYFDIRRASLGWVAVVFCTAVLGYDKGVVIK